MPYITPIHICKLSFGWALVGSLYEANNSDLQQTSTLDDTASVSNTIEKTAITKGINQITDVRRLPKT